MYQKVKRFRLECFWTLGKVRRFQRYLQKGKQRSARHSNPLSRQQMCRKWAQRSQESKWEFGGEVGDGAENRVMKCEICTEMTRRGVAGIGSCSEGCRGAEHGQTYIRTSAVAVRAALEVAVQLRRGDEVNRQAEMANPKCRDSKLTPHCRDTPLTYTETRSCGFKPAIWPDSSANAHACCALEAYTVWGP
jgi:hypothetical protein